MKHIIIKTDLKMKNQPTQQEKVIEGSIDLFDMPFLGDEDVKERKGLKILTPNTFLTRLPILLAQIKAENN